MGWLLLFESSPSTRLRESVHELRIHGASPNNATSERYESIVAIDFILFIRSNSLNSAAVYGVEHRSPPAEVAKGSDGRRDAMSERREGRRIMPSRDNCGREGSEDEDPTEKGEEPAIPEAV